MSISIPELLNLYTERKRDINCVKKLGYECEEFIFVKRLKKTTKTKINTNNITLL